MKGEKWFREKATIDLAYLLDQDGAYVVDEMVGFLLSIYRQGRADQNEADVEVIKGYTKVHPLSWRYTPSALTAAIRAAGPEVKE